MDENSLKKELTLTRIVNAPVDMVFKAWTDKEQIAKWWGPNGVTSEVDSWGSNPGDALDVTMVAGEELGEMKGQRWPMKGELKEIVPNKRIVFNGDAQVDGKSVMENQNTVTFEDMGGKTKITLHIQVLRATPEAAMPLAGMEMGWSQSLDKLTKLVEA